MVSSNQTLAGGLLAVSALFSLLAAFLLLREARHRDLQARVLAITAGDADPPRRAIIGGLLRAIGQKAINGSRLYSKKDIELLEDVIAACGLNPRRTVPIILGGKLVLMLGVPLLALLSCDLFVAAPMTRLAIVAASVPAGMLFPEWALRLLTRSRTAAMRRGVIDALDLLVVSCEAGLALESALERVAHEMQHSNRPTADALYGLLDGLRVLPDRREAFIKFARRTRVEGMQRLGLVLVQSLQYGTPLGQALRAMASELRRERMTRLEERAAKLPAKLVMPLVLFILPCLIIVLVGSSFMRLFDTLSALTH